MRENVKMDGLDMIFIVVVSMGMIALVVYLGILASNELIASEDSISSNQTTESHDDGLIIEDSGWKSYSVTKTKSVYILVDPETKVQYIVSVKHNGIGITPRLNVDGTLMLENSTVATSGDKIIEETH